MNSVIQKLMMSAAVLLTVFGTALGQFDDIYFNPDQADEIYSEVELQKYLETENPSAPNVNDDYDYYYTSQIRRFNNPYVGFDFYSPVYVDPAYYNPYYSNFYRPGSSIYWGGAYAAPVSGSQVFVSSGWGGNPYGGYSTFGTYTTTTWNNGFGTASAFPGSYNSFGGASFGGGGFGSPAGGIGGVNAYCPPSYYSNSSIGVINPGTGVANGPTNTNPRTVGSSQGTVYGPRGSGGSVTTSPRNNTNTGGSVSAPDRPLTTAGTTSTRTSPRSAQQSYTGADANRARYAARSSRPAYTPPSSSGTRNTFTRTDAARNRFNSTTRPSRPSYSPNAGSGLDRSSSRSTFSRPSTGSSSRSFSSPRSSGGSSRSSVSPRGGRG